MNGALVALAVLISANVSQPALEEEANRFAQAWSQEDVRALGSLMTRRGIRLHLPGEEHSRIPPRQAQAAVAEFMERYVPGEVEVTRVSIVGGSPQEGYAELRWATRASDPAEPLTFTLFVAFALEDESWRVTEIRILF
jgi:hypothetical protein